MGEIFPVRGEPSGVIDGTAIPEHGPTSPYPRSERAMTSDPADRPEDILETDEGPIPEHDDPPFDYGGES